MNVSNKLLSVLVFFSVTLNVYQYQKENTQSSTSGLEQGDGIASDVYDYNPTSNEKGCEPKSASIMPPNNVMPINSKNIEITDDIGTQNIQVIEVNQAIDYNYPEDYFKNELSLYLDEDMVSLLNESDNNEENLQFINMLSSNDVRDQDIESESKFRDLFEKYRDIIISGSEDYRCNSSGCYVTYTLTDSKEGNNIFFDFPRIKGSNTSGYTITNPDGTSRYVNLILIP